MPTKAVAYLRVSGRGQIDGDGFDRQADAVARFAKSAGLEVVATYRDEGVSGTTELAARVGLAELLDRIDSNGVRVVVVERADRLARDLMVGELLLAEFRKRGVRVLSAEGGVELTEATDPTAVLIRQVLGAVAEFEKSVVVAKLRAARDRRSRAAGGVRIEGRKPFGHYAGEGDALERMRALRRKPRGGSRRSFASIADTLNAERVPTRTGKAWQPETVRRILQRETTMA